ncbi:MAG: glycosyltransferase family 2 protein [Chloroflexi bacterium]|jgi:glycosyltransferase involved in cell wall biosynthesis|nr:glycosyltransferase family 2 protein [Chloroflexota bacterium]
MADELPLVTVIMPIRNEADFIVRSLGAVLAQDYPPERVEIIIADGMSSDGTRAEIARLAAQHPERAITVIDNPRQIVPAGMNLAQGIARGEIIVRVDGHCEIAPDYISQCVAHLQRGEAGGVGGPIETVGQTPYGQSIALAMSSWFGVGGAAFRTVKDRALYADTLAFPAYRRDVIERAGPYDETLVRNQDDEYNYRLRKLGFRLLLTPKIRSRYYSRATLRRVWQQYYQYGFYKVRVLQKHPRQMSLRQFVPPLFVAALILGGALAVFSPLARLLWALVIIAYAVVNLSTSAALAARHGWQHLRRLPLVFAALHLSYGLGFWHGVWHFGLQAKHATKN